MRLIISNLEDFSQSDIKKSRFLGIWCFKGREKEFESWEDIPFVENPYRNVEELRSAEKEILNSAYFFEKEITKYLNKIHSMDMPTKFWRPIIRSWLIIGLMLLYSHYKRLNNIFTEGEWSVNLLNDLNAPITHDTHDFFNHAQKDNYFNYWLISRIIENLNFNNINIDYQKFTVPKKNKEQRHSQKLSIKQKISITLDKIIDQYGFNNKNTLFVEVSGIKRLDKLILLKTIDKRNDVVDNIIENFEPNTDNLDKKFINLSRNILFQLLPASFKDKRLLNNYYKLPKLVIAGPSQFYDQKYQVALAKNNIDNKSKIIGSQHGSAYGTYNVYPIVNFLEYEQSDKFITWGWERHSDYNVNSVVLPSPYLSKVYNRHQRKNNRLIIVLSGNWYYTDYRLGSMLKSNYVIQQTKKRIAFIQSLNSEIYNNTFIRGHFSSDNQYPQEQLLVESFNDLRFINGNIDSKLLKCKSIVMDHPGTTFHLAMAMNIPGIYYWDPSDFPLSKQAKPYFDLFRENGILYDNPFEASKKINSVWENIDDWWKSDKIQSARNNFCNNYARCNLNWRKEWVKFINEL